MRESTETQYRVTISRCKDIFRKKASDYGDSWKIMRMPSVTDQILIKAKRIRSIQEKNKQEVEENIENEFAGIINYCLIALIKMTKKQEGKEDAQEGIQSIYDTAVNETLGLLKRKNHDYDEAWREMRVSSMTDIILMKLLRIKQIEDNQGKTIISEGVATNYQDIINYSIFCLINMEEG